MQRKEREREKPPERVLCYTTMQKKYIQFRIMRERTILCWNYELCPSEVNVATAYIQNVIYACREVQKEMHESKEREKKGR